MPSLAMKRAGDLQAPATWTRLCRRHLLAIVSVDIERRIGRNSEEASAEVIHAASFERESDDDDADRRTLRTQHDREALELAAELWAIASSDREQLADQRPDYCIVLHLDTDESEASTWHSPRLTQAEEQAASMRDLKSTDPVAAYLIAQNRDLHGELMKTHRELRTAATAGLRVVEPVLNSVQQLAEGHTALQQLVLQAVADQREADPVPWEKIIAAVGYTVQQIKEVHAGLGPAQPANNPGPEPVKQSLRTFAETLTDDQTAKLADILGADLLGDVTAVLELADDPAIPDDVVADAMVKLKGELIPHAMQLLGVLTPQQQALLMSATGDAA